MAYRRGGRKGHRRGRHRRGNRGRSSRRRGVRSLKIGYRM